MSTLGLIGYKLPVPRIDGVRPRSKDEGCLSSIGCGYSAAPHRWKLIISSRAGYCRPQKAIGFTSPHGLPQTACARVFGMILPLAVTDMHGFTPGMLVTIGHAVAATTRPHNPRFATAASRRASATSQSASARVVTSPGPSGSNATARRRGTRRAARRARRRPRPSSRRPGECSCPP